MKTLFNNLIILSLSALISTTASAQITNSHYVCEPTAQQKNDSIEKLEILEQLVPVGELAPAYRHVWSIVIGKANTLATNSELSFVETLGHYPNLIKIFKDGDFTVEVENDVARVIDKSGTSECIAMEYME